jgi:hypothetical protein
MISVNGMTNKALVLALSCLLMSCAAPVSDVAVDSDAVRRRAEQILLEQEAKAQQQLRVLLANAQRALAADKLKTPEFDNAFSWYKQVLAIDELNKEAHQGMRLITKRYLELAEQAFNSGRVELAEKMLTGAESIAAHPSVIEGLRERYRKNADDKTSYLPIKLLSARGDAIQQQLKLLAQQLTPEQRLLIVARSDDEGRWIYQQMRQSVNGFRLRGNIELGRVPRVVIIDM